MNLTCPRRNNGPLGTKWHTCPEMDRTVDTCDNFHVYTVAYVRFLYYDLLNTSYHCVSKTEFCVLSIRNCILYEICWIIFHYNYLMTRYLTTWVKNVLLMFNVSTFRRYHDHVLTRSHINRRFCVIFLCLRKRFYCNYTHVHTQHARTHRVQSGFLKY